MSLLKFVWGDIVKFWNWLVYEESVWYNEGGKTVLQDILNMAITAGEAWLVTNPVGIFTGAFEAEIAAYIKANWKNDAVTLADSEIAFAVSAAAIQLKIPSVTPNQGVFPGGTQTA
jgi:hypothetical protein